MEGSGVAVRAEGQVDICGQQLAGTQLSLRSGVPILLLLIKAEMKEASPRA